MRRSLLWLVGLVACAAAFAGVAIAGSHITEPTTIEVLEVGKGGTFVDTGVPGFSPADHLTIKHRLFTPDGTTRLGEVRGSCIAVVVTKGREEWECVATARFADGNVMVAGSFPPPETSPAWAVTGGTGLYENARGTMSFGGTDPNTILTFSLIP